MHRLCGVANLGSHWWRWLVSGLIWASRAGPTASAIMRASRVTSRSSETCKPAETAGKKLSHWQRRPQTQFRGSRWQRSIMAGSSQPRMEAAESHTVCSPAQKLTQQPEGSLPLAIVDLAIGDGVSVRNLVLQHVHHSDSSTIWNRIEEQLRSQLHIHMACSPGRCPYSAAA